VVAEIVDNHVSHDVVVLYHQYAWGVAVGVFHAVITGEARCSGVPAPDMNAGGSGTSTIFRPARRSELGAAGRRGVQPDLN